MRWLHVLRVRLRNLVQRRKVERELDEELQFHLDHERGVPVPFGNPAVIKEECREARRTAYVENVLRDVRHGLRGILRQPMLTAAAVLSLGLGAGLNAVIFSLSTELVLSEISVRDVGSVVFTRTTNSSHVSWNTWRELDRSGALAGLAGCHVEGMIGWRASESAIPVMPMLVTPNFFDVLGLPIAEGRGFNRKEVDGGASLVVISHGFWQRRLGGAADAVGRVLHFDGQPYTVTGVLPQQFRSVLGMGVAPEVYLPMSNRTLPGLENRRGTVQLIGRLKPGQSLDRGRESLNAALQALPLETGSGGRTAIGRFLPAFSGMLASEMREITLFFAMLLALSILVVGIACANIAGLLIARNAARRKELSIRLAIGAGRGRIFQQLVVEAGLLCTLGMAAALLVNQLATVMLNRVQLPLPLPFELHIAPGWRLFAYAAFVGVCTTLACGLLPALQAARRDLMPAMQDAGARLVLRRWLVGAQTAVAVILLLTATLFLRNLSMTNTAKPGFDVENTAILEVSLPAQMMLMPAALQSWADDVKRRLEAVPGVVRAAYSEGVPLTIRHGSRSGTSLQWEDGQTVRVEFVENRTSAGYLDAMGIPLTAGRDFQPSDTAAIIVNEEFARRYSPGRNPIGRTMKLGGGKELLLIVGVAADSKYWTLGEAKRPSIYSYWRTFLPGDTTVMFTVRASAPPSHLLKPLQLSLNGTSSSIAVEARTMREALRFAFVPSQVGAAIAGSVGLLGLLLAAIGLYGVIAYSVERQTREIGVRMALGADRASIFGFVLRQGVSFTALGALVGLAVGWLAMRPLAMFVVENLAEDSVATVLPALAVLAVVCILAMLVPARRAARINPISALRVD